MKDIVERLDGLLSKLTDFDTIEAFVDAKAEITRLRDALAEADDLLHGDTVTMGTEAWCSRLEAWDATCEALFPPPPEVKP